MKLKTLSCFIGEQNHKPGFKLDLHLAGKCNKLTGILSG